MMTNTEIRNFLVAQIYRVEAGWVHEVSTDWKTIASKDASVNLDCEVVCLFEVLKRQYIDIDFAQ